MQTNYKTYDPILGTAEGTASPVVLNLPSRYAYPHSKPEQRENPVPKTVTRMDLVNAIHGETVLSQADCIDLLEAVLNRMSDTLANGEQVKISSFATFSVRHKKERAGRNPKTGEVATVSARNVVDFKASQDLKRRLSQVDHSKD